MTISDVEQLRISLIIGLPATSKYTIKSDDFKKVINTYSDMLNNLIRDNELLTKQLADAKCDVRTVIKYIRSR